MPSLSPPLPGVRARLKIAALVAVAASFVLALIVSPPAGAADTLLSQGKTAIASSTENAVFTAPSAVDGDPGTRWSSAHGVDPQWIQIDLGQTATVNQVVLNWETAAAKAFQLQVSADGTNWNSIYSTTTSTGGDQTLTVSGSGRYVRMLGTQRTTQWGYSLWEFKVFGTTSGTGPGPGSKLLSYGKTGAASSQQNDGNCWECTPARAFDLDPASRWATTTDSGWVDPGWISVDLGATAQIDKVILQWDPASAKSYQIQVSNDNVNWSPIYTTTNGPGFKETLNITGTGRSTAPVARRPLRRRRRPTRRTRRSWSGPTSSTAPAAPSPTPTSGAPIRATARTVSCRSTRTTTTRRWTAPGTWCSRRVVRSHRARPARSTRSPVAAPVSTRPHG
jgi:hypothetical protein